MEMLLAACVDSDALQHGAEIPEVSVPTRSRSMFGPVMLSAVSKVMGSVLNKSDSSRPRLRGSFAIASLVFQYVARPPERSNTAPVLNEHSSEHNQATSAAASSRLPKRPRGIFESM